MNRKGFALIVLIVAIAVLLIIGGLWYYGAHNSISGQVPAIQTVVTTSLAQPISNPATSIPPSPTVFQPTPSTTVSIFTSSSSAQVGNFTIVAYCSLLGNDPDVAVVKQIDILNGGAVVQTINPGRGLAPGGGNCPQPRSQDINFDGYPDFMIASDYGSGGTSVNYWLFNTSTQQFFCPGGNPVGCTMMNPSFDPASKTISESDELGASDSVFWVYKVNGDNLTLYQETDVTYSGTTTTNIVKQLEGGRMVVVSTSTTPSSN